MENKTPIHHSRAGLKITVRFATQSEYSRVKLGASDAIVTEHARMDANGVPESGFVGSAVKSPVSAFAAWLCPATDSFNEPRRAQYAQWNTEDGTIEAAVYPEFASDVMRKVFRMRPKHFEFHTVCI